MPTAEVTSPDLAGRGAGFAEFWSEKRYATLTTVRADGTAHVVPVGVTVDLDAGIVRVICSGTSYKARQAVAAGNDGVAVAVCQHDGRHWSTLEGRAVVRDDPAAVADAERRYAERYRTPRPNPRRVVLEITVTKVLGNA